MFSSLCSTTGTGRETAAGHARRRDSGGRPGRYRRGVTTIDTRIRRSFRVIAARPMAAAPTPCGRAPPPAGRQQGWTTQVVRSVVSGRASTAVEVYCGTTTPSSSGPWKVATWSPVWLFTNDPTLLRPSLRTS